MISRAPKRNVRQDTPRGSNAPRAIRKCVGAAEVRGVLVVRVARAGAVWAAIVVGAGGFDVAGGKRAIPLTKGTGYCVSVTDDGSFRGKVLVPFHKPELKKLEALRLSVGNAVNLIGTQETDERHRGNIVAAAGHIVFEGENVARAEVCITRCACASKVPDQDHEIGAPVCGGPCRDCWDCRIDCTGLPGGD